MVSDSVRHWPDMLATLIQSLRHLKHPNLSTGDDFICSRGIFLLIQFLKMTLSCQADQYGRLDILNIKICPLFQTLRGD